MLQQLVGSVAQLQPTVLFVDPEMTGTVALLPPEWRVHNVDAALFASEVLRALVQGPVVAIPPWYGKRDDRRVQAGDALRSVDSVNGNPLVTILPASTLVSPSARLFVLSCSRGGGLLSSHARRRIEELVQFGRSEYLDHLFEIVRGPARDQDLEEREPYSPGAIRLVTGRDVTRNNEISVSDGVKWVSAAPDAQLRTGDILVRAIQNIHPDSPGLVWARVEEADLPLVASSTVLVLRPRAATSADDVDFCVAVPVVSTFS
jgi:hypothetical protein